MAEQFLKYNSQFACQKSKELQKYRSHLFNV